MINITSIYFKHFRLSFSILKIICVLYFISNFTDIKAQSNISNLNGYKYALVSELKYEDGSIDVWGISEVISLTLSQKGFTLLNSKAEIENLKDNYTQVVYVFIEHSMICEGCGAKKVYLKFKNFKNEIIYKSEGSGICMVSLKCEVEKATKNALRDLYALSYSFNENLTPKIIYPEVEKTIENEQSLINYFQTNNLEEIEGIYKTYNSGSMGYYKIGIKKNNGKYYAIVIESEYSQWKTGEVKAIFEAASMKGLFSTKWFMSDKTSTETFSSLDNDGILTIEFTNPQTGEKATSKIIKMFPNSDSNFKSNTNNIKATGSGVIISTTGIIATNAHVIEEYNKLEILLNTDIGIKTYKVTLLLKDVVNDIAILKIEDEEFKGFNTLPFAIDEKTDIGEDVFTIGYPLTGIMGDNYKVTNGIISSNSGLKDDVRFVQTTTPIQPGNSGGPLFNKKGNLIGLTTSKLNEDVVGTSIENVNFAIKSAFKIFSYISFFLAITDNLFIPS